MQRKLIVIFGLTITVLFLLGCIDVNDYEGCKNSYDNLKRENIKSKLRIKANGGKING